MGANGLRYRSLIPLAFLTILTFVGCEDVVEINVPTGKTRLIIDALTRIGIDDEFIPFEIKVTTTNNFFEETPVTSLDRIVILVESYDEDGDFLEAGNIYLAERENGSGIYVPDPCCEINFFPTNAIDEYTLFTLFIDYEEKQYFGQSKYIASVPIDDIKIDNTGSIRSNETEIEVTFTDDPNKQNFYLFDFDFDKYLVTDDKFYSGQQFKFSYFYDSLFEPGTDLEISILGIDEALSNYMSLLIEQSEKPQDLFQTPVATVRGNIFDFTGLDNIEIFDNVERPDDFPLGYFAIVQEFKQTVKVD